MTVTTITTGSKPDQIAALRKVWRASTEHKKAQVIRFLSALVGVLIAQAVGDISAGKTPFSNITDLHSLWYYLLPVAYTTWRQVHPAMTAGQADSAPGVTIVPDQVGAPVDNTPPDVPPVDPAATQEISTAPTGDMSADGTLAPPDPPAEGDAAP